MNDFERACATLEALGYRTGSAPPSHSHAALMYYKRMNTRVKCECNDKPPSVFVVLYAQQHGMAAAYEIEICNERGKAWYKLLSYSHQCSRLTPARLARQVSALRRAWEVL